VKELAQQSFPDLFDSDVIDAAANLEVQQKLKNSGLN
jgi:hypothetical protein